jgi:peptidoglycan hydrolase-like protein with peptidoglycan-binding domain
VIAGLALTLAGETWLGYYRPESPEVASLISMTMPGETAATSPAAEPQSAATGAAVQLASLPATTSDARPIEFVNEEQTEADVPKDGPAASLSPATAKLTSQSHPAAEDDILLRALMNAPKAAPAASPSPRTVPLNSQSQPAFDGETLLRALLLEYTRAMPPNGEGAKAALGKVASSFGLDMIPIRTELARLKRFRVACLLETHEPIRPEPTFVILRGSSPEGVELTDALGGMRWLTDAEFAKLWSGRAYLFHGSGTDWKNVLARGSQSSEVWGLQKRLGELGYFGGEPTGSFDDVTAEAVRRLQRDHALQVDGMAGPATKIVLYHLSGQPLAEPKQP